MGENYLLVGLIELDNLERQLLAYICRSAVLLLEILDGACALNAFTERDDSSLVCKARDRTLMDGAERILGLEHVPRILLQLLVTEAQTTVLFVDLENDYLKLVSDRGEL